MLSLRTLLRHPIQFTLMTLGIALGVAVMVSIDLANASASRAFDLSTTAVTGRATHAILGSGQGVDEALYVRLRTDPVWRRQMELAPSVRAYARSPQLGDIPFTLLGIDPFAETPFRGYLGTQPTNSLDVVGTLLTQRGAILLSAQTARQYGLYPCPPGQINADCQLTLFINGETHDAYLAGLLEPSDDLSRRALDTVILTDIATAQSLSTTQGKLTQIDLILPDRFDTEAFTATLPSGVLLVPSETRNSQVMEMTAAFQVNLTALSLLALTVGVFLIYNTMTFSVVQRRSLFGTLRSIGFTREQVFGMVLGEAAIVGAIGTILGLGLGILLGQGAVKMVTQTINDLFFVVSVRGIQIPVSSLIKGAFVGVLSSLLAAAPPAWEAASVQPRLALIRSGLESKAQKAVNLAAGLGVLFTFLGAAILWVPTRNLVVSFSGTFAIVFGLAAVTPYGTAKLMHLVGKPFALLLGFLGRLAPRNVIRSQSRTAIAVAALMVSVAVTIGVQVMISSFRSTVTLWLEQTLKGDIYISTQGLSANRLDTPLDPQAVALAQKYPSAVDSALVRVVTVESEHGPLELLASNSTMDDRLFLVGNPQNAMKILKDGAILLSEPLANRLEIFTADGSISLLTPQGFRSFPIAGIYFDYASTRGTIRMNLDVYRELWNDQAINGIALFLPPNADADEVTTDLQRQMTGFNIQVAPSKMLRQEALKVFDRTFAITSAMQLVTTVVAFIGILSSLLALQLEKAREIGILRAIGLTLAEMRRLTLLETGLLGASAGLLALPTGYILAWILIFVINQRSFGWTLQMHANMVPFAQAFLLAVSAALLAGIYPAYHISRIQTAAALRGE